MGTRKNRKESSLEMQGCRGPSQKVQLLTAKSSRKDSKAQAVQLLGRMQVSGSSSSAFPEPGGIEEAVLGRGESPALCAAFLPHHTNPAPQADAALPH